MADDREKISTGPNEEPINETIAGTGPGIPDDALAPIARSIRMYGGQAMIHTSGALGAEVLEPAQAAGSQIGSFQGARTMQGVPEDSAARRAATASAISPAPRFARSKSRSARE